MKLLVAMLVLLISTTAIAAELATKAPPAILTLTVTPTQLEAIAQALAARIAETQALMRQSQEQIQRQTDAPSSQAEGF